LLIKQRKQYGDNEKKADRENLKKLLARAENIADGDGVKLYSPPLLGITFHSLSRKYISFAHIALI